MEMQFSLLDSRESGIDSFLMAPLSYYSSINPRERLGGRRHTRVTRSRLPCKVVASKFVFHVVSSSHRPSPEFSLLCISSLRLLRYGGSSCHAPSPMQRASQQRVPMPTLIHHLPSPPHRNPRSPHKALPTPLTLPAFLGRAISNCQNPTSPPHPLHQLRLRRRSRKLPVCAQKEPRRGRPRLHYGIGL